MVVAVFWSYSVAKKNNKNNTDSKLLVMFALISSKYINTRNNNPLKMIWILKAVGCGEYTLCHIDRILTTTTLYLCIWFREMRTNFRARAHRRIRVESRVCLFRDHYQRKTKRRRERLNTRNENGKRTKTSAKKCWHVNDMLLRNDKSKTV